MSAGLCWSGHTLSGHFVHHWSVLSLRNMTSKIDSSRIKCGASLAFRQFGALRTPKGEDFSVWTWTPMKMKSSYEDPHLRKPPVAAAGSDLLRVGVGLPTDECPCKR
uniref:Uncharacterized protein n=1 Tax=Steinernema glaseri TaxID=37863 RepID=A0A1I7YA96_9BILA